MADPLRKPGAANIGSAGLARNASAKWELGAVVSYNSATHTAVVKTHSGRPLRDVPQIKPTGGGYDHLETGTTVVICWNLGIPAIIGCMDFASLEQAAIAPPSITGVEGYGDADPTQDVDGLNSYKPPRAPVDMQQGDWAQVGADGNHVAVMAGGLTAVGSPTAQVRSFGRSGVLQHIARRLESFSDFGTWRAENDQGRTSFVLRAGSSQATETGLDEQHWTIRLDLGATGDVLDFSISDPGGRLLFRLHAGSDGRVQLYGDGGVDMSSGARGTAQMRHDVAGGRVAEVTHDDVTAIGGARRVAVEGSSDEQVTGDVTTAIGGTSTCVVAGDCATATGGDRADVVTGNVSSKVGGSLDAGVSKDVALDVDGGMKVDVGKAASIKAKGLATLDGHRVRLGSGSHPMAKFDVFLRDLSDFLGHLMTAIGALTPSSPIALAAQVAMMQRFVILTGQAFPYESSKCSNE